MKQMNIKPVLRNLLTFDLEDWYHGNFIYNDTSNIDKVDRVVEPTLKILELLKNTGNYATFFVLGCVAEKYADLIKQIYNQGHEIASHSYNHNIVYNLKPEEFSQDLEKSIKILEKTINDKIIGYRAPYWSVNKDMDWAWPILKQNGIRYDSSIYPFKTYLYGDNDAPRFKYEISLQKANRLIEIPPTTLEVCKKRIPFCGGFYFRLLPYQLVKWGIKRVNKSDMRVMFVN